MTKGDNSGGQDRNWNENSDVSVETSNAGADQRSATELSAGAAQRFTVLGEITGELVHDFRNILAVIDSGLRLAENNSNDPRAAFAFIAGAREGVNRGLALTSQLLTFAKQREFKTCAADVNELLKALELFLQYSAGSEVRVVVELSPNVPTCVIDPSQFNAAILNLVINARDAMPKGGEVRISTALMLVESGASGATPGNYVRVRVSDNGPGMADEVLERIFQPFFTTKGEQGTGLGVPQVGAFMRRIGGHVCVASDTGHGTTFDLFLPVMDANSARPRCIEIKAATLPRLQ